MIAMDSFCTLMVFNITAALNGFWINIVKLSKDCFIRLAHDIGKNIKAAPMSHSYNHIRCTK